jgi:hypothetical protein
MTNEIPGFSTAGDRFSHFLAESLEEPQPEDTGGKGTDCPEIDQKIAKTFTTSQRELGNDVVD